VRKTWLSALAVAVLLGTSAVGMAQQELKPVVVVSISSYDRLMGDIDFLGELTGKPGASKQLEMMLQFMTGGKGLAGVDKAKPWGVVVQTDGQAFPAVGLLPVTDLKAFLGALPGQTGEPKDTGGGVFEVNAGRQSLYVQEKGGWAVIARKADDLKSAPADAAKLLGPLSDKYDVAASVSVKNIPEAIRQKAIEQLKAGAEASVRQEPGESDEHFAARKKLTQQPLEQLTRLIDDLDTVLVGLSIDRQAKTTSLELTFTAIAGTETAKDFAQASNLTSDFAGFELPGAAVVAQLARKLTDSDVTQMMSTLNSVRANALEELGNQGLPEEQEKQAKQLLEGLMDVVQETVQGKRMEAGLVIQLGPAAATLVSGGYVADGAKLEKLVKEIAAVAKEEKPEIAQFIKLDAEQYGGLNFHLVSVPLPADDPGAQKLAKLVGDKLELVIAIGPKAAYAAVGRDAVKTLKTVIDQCKANAGKAVLPARISVAAGPIAKFIAAAVDEPQVQQVAAKVAGVLEPLAGKDRLNITSKGVPNGVTIRIELEEGILKMLGSLAPQPRLGPPGAMPGPGF
jgi:hypothetical protein